MDEADRPYCQDSYTSCDQTQKIYPAIRPISGSGKWKYCICSIAVALIASLVTIYLMDKYAFQESLEYSWFRENGALDSEVLSLFVSYDTNMDGKLDKNEFVPIANRILNRKVCNGQYLLGLMVSYPRMHVGCMSDPSLLLGGTRGFSKNFASLG